MYTIHCTIKHVYYTFQYVQSGTREETALVV